MTGPRTPLPGAVYWIDPNLITGREIRDRHRFVVITPQEINALGIVMAVPITTSGAFTRRNGLTVPIMGHDTTGMAVCNQVRSFDIAARERVGTACYIETLNADTTTEIINRVLSVIDPER